MQNRYVGDIGDYAKYALLRAIGRGLQLGVAWYLYPDEGHNADGKHTSYLDAPAKWRLLDPDLFDGLKKLVAEDRRCVDSFKESQLLPSARFSSQILSSELRSYAQRAAWRVAWFERVVADLEDCDFVFADPDNGLCDDDRFKAGRVKDWKRLPMNEARRLAQGRTAVIYHHNTRWPGGHEAEIRHWVGELGEGTMAVKWSAYGNRTFFVMNPPDEIRARLTAFADRWGTKATLLG